MPEKESSGFLKKIPLEKGGKVEREEKKEEDWGEKLEEKMKHKVGLIGSDIEGERIERIKRKASNIQAGEIQEGRPISIEVARKKALKEIGLEIKADMDRRRKEIFGEFEQKYGPISKATVEKFEEYAKGAEIEKIINEILDKTEYDERKFVKDWGYKALRELAEKEYKVRTGLAEKAFKEKEK